MQHSARPNSRGAVTLVALATVAASSLVTGHAGAQDAAPAAAAGAHFRAGELYAGPRIWIGNLNGAMAIGAQVERGITEPGRYGPGIISGGVGVDYYRWSQDFTSFGSYQYSVIPIQAFSNYHFVIEGRRALDPYLGLALVYSVVSASWDGPGASGATSAASGVGLAGQAGMRYFVSPTLAVQGQVGFGYGTLGLGATWRF